MASLRIHRLTLIDSMHPSVIFTKQATNISRKSFHYGEAISQKYYTITYVDGKF